MADLLEMNASAGGKSPAIMQEAGMTDALQAAAEIAEPGDVVLLAPGGTSFDAYVDFAARGEAFRIEVSKLADSQTGATGRNSYARPEEQTQDEV